MVTRRAHIFLPEDLLEEVDRITGKRRRSRFIEVAIREKLSREALTAALEESAGVLSTDSYPEWGTPEKTSDSVRRGRQDDNTGLVRQLSAWRR